MEMSRETCLDTVLAEQLEGHGTIFFGHREVGIREGSPIIQRSPFYRIRRVPGQILWVFKFVVQEPRVMREHKYACGLMISGVLETILKPTMLSVEYPFGTRRINIYDIVKNNVVRPIRPERQVLISKR